MEYAPKSYSAVLPKLFSASSSLFLHSQPLPVFCTMTPNGGTHDLPPRAKGNAGRKGNDNHG